MLVEDKSTNCGANAIETRRILESHSVAIPKEIMVVQDPTMARRTVAGFRKVYEDVGDQIEFQFCPTFVPCVQEAASSEGSALCFDDALRRYPASSIWEMPRFIDLLLGEIPRLRDDGNGYGPRGKGFIAHVDVPEEVEEAWQVLNRMFGNGGEMGRGQIG